MMGLKIVTIGGGSSYTPELIEGFIKRYDTLPVTEIWLVDIEEGREKLNIICELANRMIKKSGLPISVYGTLDRTTALKDADFVTTQIRVGGLEARILDEKIPLKYKVIGQETNGPGGLFKALRTIPVILDIAAEMEKLCPNAWLINFTNPAGMVTEAVLKYGKIKKVVGLCNVPIHMEMNIAKALEVEPNRIRVDFAGLNHMVYGLNVYLDGARVTEKVIETILNGNVSMSMKNIIDLDWEKDFIKALGVLPCPYHRYYYKADEMLNNELSEAETVGTRGEVVKQIEKELFELYKDQNLDIKPPQLEKRGGAYYSDAACRLIESIYNDRKDIQVVNIRNNGAISGIPRDSAIEISCVITKEGPVPCTLGELPIATKGLIMQIKAFEIISVEAAITGDYHKALLAMTINPLVPSDTLAKKILDEMLEAHKKYLPIFYR
ncbi:6-phospho-beta-glucosidase [Clostridium tagluense]|uniref:6-phospho-beta-glucosidase n=1 Tax=Clostridium tagluense TaxID=360422 RepID=UPI001C6E4481|nr:6-phospho-beta-glucosidase [Clostridium tagluense]MBW9158534.1 6-phospho-beta-glucosidase [Clostridium tagluense]WLC66546.1 6-phospho-beta-glucosidase [Clostridium tagluense]